MVQAQDKQPKGKELADAFRAQARKMLPEYDEAVNLAGRQEYGILPKGTPWSLVMALQTLDGLTSSHCRPCSIQGTLASLRSKTPEEHAKWLLSMSEDPAITPDFLIRVLRAAALETQADAIMHSVDAEQQAAHYITVAEEIVKIKGRETIAGRRPQDITVMVNVKELGVQIKDSTLVREDIESRATQLIEVLVGALGNEMSMAVLKLSAHAYPLLLDLRGKLNEVIAKIEKKGE